MGTVVVARRGAEGSLTLPEDAAPLRASRRVPLSLGLVLALALGALGGWLLGGRDGASRWEREIQAASVEAGVDAALLRALVTAESGGRPDAVSRRGAQGLLQLLPATAEEEARRLGWSEPDLFDPATNLTLGAMYLARLLRRYDGQEAFAVAAYNAGPTAVDRWRARAPHLAPLDVVLLEGYAETRRHVVKVLRWREVPTD